MDDYIVCRCEDVSFDDIRHCVDESDTIDIHEAKLRLRVGMGTCQGRVCGPLLERCFAGHAIGTLERNSVLRPVLLADIASEMSAGKE
ncbi:(2Fe-2S)-binding protein [Brevibacterium sp. RIT 803]|jgi:BFD-like [2Fe-2S] binding domain|uniref:(2Fe-2S)-binding protein n=1 Tax=Brevibacterium sp. RIT 803 TaxID=2810210 RepID=UPI0019513748|nr:(2Fe-2S)-binding protein [Brevibacterium sp. RIT 803]MBM6590283.1 (2Fe-2S)-binding protein [Brevibacterium sp. RIT 803]